MRRYLIAVVSVGVAFAARWMIQPALGPNLQFITFFPAVFVAAWIGGFGPGVAAVALSALIAEYFFFPPYGSFGLGSAVTAVGLLLFVAIGLGVSWLGESRRRAVARAMSEAANAKRQEAVAAESAVEAEEAAARAEEERVRAEDEAARAEAAHLEAEAAHERTRSVLDSTTDAYIGIDREWRMTYINRRTSEVLGAFGVQIQGLLGRTIWDVWPELQGTVFEREYRRVMVERVPSDFESWYPPYERWFEVHAYPTSDGIAIFFRDVTERRRADEQLQRAQRMDAVGKLAGGVAHEVNNQMTVVLGASEFLLRRPDLPEWARPDIDQIRQAARRSATITGQLLAFGRRQFLRPEPLDLNTVVVEMEEILRRTVGSAIELAFSLDPGLGTVMADRGQLSQAILNLTLNAKDAMPRGGTLRIDSVNVELPAGNSVDGGVEAVPGPYVALRVSDTGVGMDRATLTRVFEPFFTTKALGQGTGLGLSTVYGIVRQSGGYITVESAPGAGSAFTVYLPRIAAAPVPAVTDDRAAAAAPARNSRGVAVVVEDEASVRSMVSRVLEEDGFRVLQAENGEDALRVIEQAHLDGALRLVVTDLAMPVMGGRELSERLAALGHRVPLLFMSGYTSDDVVRRGLLAAGQDFLQKPFSPEVLSDRVHQLAPRRPAGA